MQPMTEYATSADGTRIAFERRGNGSAIVLVGGLLSDGASHRPLAEALAPSFTAVTFDRRGRGESGDTAPYAVEREIEDIAAVMALRDGAVALYGHSSGAALALRVAAAGVPVSRLILHEPPFGADDEASRAETRALAEAVRDAVEAGHPEKAVRAFMGAMGTPDDVIAAMTADPALMRLALTMPYDHAVVGDFEGGGVPVEAVRRIEVPTLVLAGTASPEFFLETAERIAGILPNGRLQLLEGAEHGAPAEAVAPAVRAFIGAALS